MFYDHERFQAFCRRCYKKFERDTAEEAVLAAEEHEQECIGGVHVEAAQAEERA